MRLKPALLPLVVTIAALFLCSPESNPISASGAVTDIDGNVYHTVTIGTQVWMVENLKTTKCNDGTPIALATDGLAWSNLTTAGYFWYNDSASYGLTYGALYNWYAVNTGKLAPIGWHVPTDSEWTVLITYLGGDSAAAGKLKEAGTVHWVSPNNDATNASGFTALPGGYRLSDGLFFENAGISGDWWSATSDGASYAWLRAMGGGARVLRAHDNVQDGFSVRCIRD